MSSYGYKYPPSCDINNYTKPQYSSGKGLKTNKHVNGFLLKYSIVQNVSKCLIRLSPHDISTSICKKKSCHFDSIIKCVTLQEKALVSIFRIVTISHAAIQNT
jgi:hypothetical protein